MRKVAGGIAITGRLDIKRTSSFAQLSRAHSQQALEFLRSVFRRRLRAKAHVENVHAGRIRLAITAFCGAETLQKRSLQPQARVFLHDASGCRIESHYGESGRNAPPAKAVVGRRRRHAGDAGAMVAQQAEVEGVIARSARRVTVAEVE